MTLYFNGGTQPLVPEGRWGEGVIMPGEPYETDAVLGPPWTQDEEAAKALSAVPDPPVPDPSSAPSDGVSGAGNGLSGDIQGTPPTHMLAGAEVVAAAESTPLRVEPNGDVVTDSGVVIGHVDNPQPGGTA